jgi:hypothetical protein
VEHVSGHDHVNDRSSSSQYAIEETCVMLDHYTPDVTHFHVVVTLLEELRTIRSKSRDEIPSHELAMGYSEAPQMSQRVKSKAKRRPHGWRLVVARLTQQLRIAFKTR